MTKRFRILTVLSDQRLAERFQGLLSRRMIDINRVPSGAGALILTGNLGYDLIIIEHPLKDLAVEDFVASIRTLDSTSTSSPVLILTKKDEKIAVAECCDDDLVKVLAKDGDDDEINEALSFLLGVATRYSTRVMVQIEVGLEDGITTRIYQAANLSESGMLLRGGRHIPVGTPVRFEFSLPNEADPIAGIAQVIRHTTESEPTFGIALQFAELAEDCVGRVRRYAAKVDSEEPVTAALNEAHGGKTAEQT